MPAECDLCDAFSVEANVLVVDETLDDAPRLVRITMLSFCTVTRIAFASSSV